MALRRQRRLESDSEEEESDALDDAFGLVAQGLLRVQAALRLQKQQVQETLRLQEQRASAALRDALQQMEEKLQERDDAIRALRRELDGRMRKEEARMNKLEELFITFRGHQAGEEDERQEAMEQLEARMKNLELSVQRALATVFPRVDALVVQLEKQLASRLTHAQIPAFDTSSESISSSPCLPTSAVASSSSAASFSRSWSSTAPSPSSATTSYVSISPRRWPPPTSTTIVAPCLLTPPATPTAPMSPRRWPPPVPGSVTPRPRLPSPSPSASHSSTSTACIARLPASSSACVGTSSHPRPPPAGALGLPASTTACASTSSHPRLPAALGPTAMNGEAAGAREEPPPSNEGEHERQRMELRVQKAVAKRDRALAALGLM